MTILEVCQHRDERLTKTSPPPPPFHLQLMPFFRSSRDGTQAPYPPPQPMWHDMQGRVIPARRFFSRAPCSRRVHCTALAWSLSGRQAVFSSPSAAALQMLPVCSSTSCCADLLTPLRRASNSAVRWSSAKWRRGSWALMNKSFACAAGAASIAAVQKTLTTSYVFLTGWLQTVISQAPKPAPVHSYSFIKHGHYLAGHWSVIAVD